MDKSLLSERDICTKFITPALRQAEWDEVLQIREEFGFTKSRIIVRGKLVTRGKGKGADYVLFSSFTNRTSRWRLLRPRTTPTVSGRYASEICHRSPRGLRRSVAAPVIRYLTDDETRRLVNACATNFRDLVSAALLTGCRYGELIVLHTSDYGADAGILTIRESKSGKVRHVVLTEEGRTLFDRLTAGRARDTQIFSRSDGKAWGASHQQRPLAEACRRAGISPAITFHSATRMDRP